MTRALAAFERYWFAAMPAQRLAVIRILVGAYAVLYLLFGFDALTDVGRFGAEHFAPAGLAKVLPAPLPKAVVVTSALVTALLGLPFVVGYRYRTFAPAFALSFLWVTSYRNSWGMLFHTENLVALHLAILAFAPASDALSFDAKTRPAPAEDAAEYGWPVRAMTAVTVVCYVLAGIAKIKLAGAGWLGGELLRAQIAYDNLRKLELGSNYSELGAWLVRHPEPFVALSWLTFALELGAPIALIGRRSATGWVLAAWLFHVGVLVLMAIPFFYQLSLVAYAAFFPVERLSQLVRAGPRPAAFLHSRQAGTRADASGGGT
jgi:hypothetical protein